MRVAITGTPGTGKTTATNELKIDTPVIHLNDVITRLEMTTGWDDERETAIVDLEEVTSWLETQPTSCVVESHLSHRLPVDFVIVLRCDPERLRERLAHRGPSGADDTAKITENVDSEVLDVIYIEAIEQHQPDTVVEIDTTDHSPGETAQAIESRIATFAESVIDAETDQ